MAHCQRIGNGPMGYVGRDELVPELGMVALDSYVIFFQMVHGERVLHCARSQPAVLPRKATIRQLIEPPAPGGVAYKRY